MRGARPEYNEPSARTVDATDIGSQHPARYGQNDCEIALGRKSWLFAGSDRGGERAAVMLTLIQTARLNGVDGLACRRAGPNCDHKITDLAAPLPWNWPHAIPVDRAA
jgi:hypothetical protein